VVIRLVSGGLFHRHRRSGSASCRQHPLAQRLGCLIGDGVTLGAVFTLFYGLIRAFMTDSEVFRFVAVAIGLVVVITLVYLRFVRSTKQAEPS
jgi:hypothetical protein